MTTESPKLNILAVASGGGHWEQLMTLRDVFDQHNVTYVTTNSDLADEAGIEALVVPDCNRNTAAESVRSMVRAFAIVFRKRPDCVISTGALPGLFCVLAGRLIGTRTIWLDSLANVEKMSMCGKVARHVAHLCLTQWEHLAVGSNPKYMGSVL